MGPVTAQRTLPDGLLAVLAGQRAYTSSWCMSWRRGGRTLLCLRKVAEQVEAPRPPGPDPSPWGEDLVQKRILVNVAKGPETRSPWVVRRTLNPWMRSVHVRDRRHRAEERRGRRSPAGFGAPRLPLLPWSLQSRAVLQAGPGAGQQGRRRTSRAPGQRPAG